MRIRFWGVRGSIPSPLLPSQIKSKISAILERLSPEDLESSVTKERFLANLQPALFGTAGGNTSCVTVQLDNANEVIVFDAGTGIRELGNAVTKERPKKKGYHIFFSHLHWDHISGLPFFNPAYDPSVRIDFYSPEDGLETSLQGQMTEPYFPIRMESMNSKKSFHTLCDSVEFAGAKISYRMMNHPGNSYSYRVDDGRNKFIYATDTELSSNDFLKNEKNCAFFSDADVIVIDSQFTIGEAKEKYNWGHNAFNLAVDFATNWNIRHMVLFHHDPAHEDHKLYDILHSAKLYRERMDKSGIKLSLAVEGMEIVL